MIMLGMVVVILTTGAWPVAQAAPVAQSAAGCIQVHTVQRGETLFRIALRYGTTYQDLQQLNGLSNADRIFAEQQLCVQVAGPLPVEGTEVRDIVALATVRIRNGPGTQYPMIGRLFKGEGAGVSGISPDHRWWRIQCGIDMNGSCWVSADPNLTRPVEFPGPGNEPAPGPIRETGEAVVESVTVQVTETYPPQVVVVLRGVLPDGCVAISDVHYVRESTTFRIRITTQRRSDARCQTVTVPFEEWIVLDAVGLPTGRYDVRVNDLVVPFTADARSDADKERILPVEQTRVRYVQAQANLRLRSGPNIVYPIIGSVASGQTVLVTGVSLDGGWWRVICPDDSVGNCFISANPVLTQVVNGF
jgi:uncharacterized protein YraI